MQKVEVVCCLERFFGLLQRVGCIIFADQRSDVANGRGAMCNQASKRAQAYVNGFGVVGDEHVMAWAPQDG